jgi:hypothetical protein
MKRITIVLVCALIVPLAFAQTRTNKTKQTATTQPAATTETATTYVAGVVRTYQPSKAIVIDGTQGAVGFALGTSARIVSRAGNAVTSALTPGQRVLVYYTGTGENRAVDRVVVVD